MADVILAPGDPAPLFAAPTPKSNDYRFDTVAGRYVALSFFGSAGDPAVATMLQALAQRIEPFDDNHAAFFGVSFDREDLAAGRLQMRVPGLRYFLDFERKIAALYGAAQTRCSYVLDERLRVLARLPMDDPSSHATALTSYVSGLPQFGREELAQAGPPVLVVPRVFEPEFCRELIAHYNQLGGEDSGFMRTDAEGRTITVVDYGLKRRRDQVIEDEKLRTAMKARIERRLVPEIRKGYQFNATRMERYIVACYDAGEGGYFRPHRDNTTKGTAHRRFAVTINLNAEEYTGGDLRFPEFGRRTYRAPSGGAVVFSCSLMHEARPVTTGRRYASLLFLYDEAAAKIREQNVGFLADEGLRNAVKASLTAAKEPAAAR